MYVHVVHIARLTSILLSRPSFVLSIRRVFRH
jgi:hypothetical protein